MSYVYTNSEPGLWTVGFYTPDGTWITESDHERRQDAVERVHWLNGGSAPPVRRPPRERSEEPDPLSEEFAKFKAAYPKRAGAQRWPDAERFFRANAAKGVSVDEMINGATRYSAFIVATGKAGTEFVMQAGSFLGRNKCWQEKWECGAQPRSRDERAEDEMDRFERAASVSRRQWAAS